MKLSRRHKRLGALAAAGLAGAVALALAVPALADANTTIHINQGNVPTTAADFKNSCDQIPSGTAKWLDGWVFILPGAVKADGNFKYIEAVFEDADGNELRYDTAGDGGIVSGSGNNKAYIITPAGLTLVDATAEVKLKGNGNGNGNSKKFNLTHACPATEDEPGQETPSEDPSSPVEESSSPTEDPSSPVEESSSPTEDPSSPVDEPSSPVDEPSSPGEEPSSPGEEQSSPGEEPSSPGEEPSSPGEESSPAESGSESDPEPSRSTPAQESSSPTGSLLPTTGSSLSFVLVAAGVLLTAGVVLLVFMRRGRETAAD